MTNSIPTTSIPLEMISVPIRILTFLFLKADMIFSRSTCSKSEWKASISKLFLNVLCKAFTLSLVEQKTYGMHYNDGASKIRRSRVIHSKRLYVYPLGRHFDTSHTTEKLVVLWYGFSPYNTEAVKRKLQIQTKIPPSDFAKGYGTQHNTNEEKLNAIYQDYLSHSKELGQEPFMVLNNA